MYVPVGQAGQQRASVPVDDPVAGAGAEGADRGDAPVGGDGHIGAAVP